MTLAGFAPAEPGSAMIPCTNAVAARPVPDGSESAIEGARKDGRVAIPSAFFPVLFQIARSDGGGGPESGVGMAVAPSRAEPRADFFPVAGRNFAPARDGQ